MQRQGERVQWQLSAHACVKPTQPLEQKVSTNVNHLHQHYVQKTSDVKILGLFFSYG